MISIEESIPSKNDNYRLAEDIFFEQFNDISFYIEDESQQNFFHCILKILFPGIRIDRIFPLNGKKNVIRESSNCRGDRKKVFIVDKDFDDVFNTQEIRDNLFYLERYSIENHLIERTAFVDYIISEKPRNNRKEINRNLNLEYLLGEIANELKELVQLHMVVQSKCPSLKNISLNHERFFNFSNGRFSINENQLRLYKSRISGELKRVDGRLTLSAQLRKVQRLLAFDSYDSCLKHMPGKYLIKMLKLTIESIFGLASRNIESFCYRIAEKCSFHSLNKLQVSISSYILL